MAICPKGKLSKSRTGKKRASNWILPKIKLVNCSKCGELAPSHRVCKKCGSYNKREILATAE